MHDEVDPAIRARAVRAARGLEAFDLLLAGGTVVDVGTGELRTEDVGVVGPLIASVHPGGTRTDAHDIRDCWGQFIAPGLVDMHVHFESSMLTPGTYAEAVCPRGTITIFCDPHELANVAGVPGVRYAVDASRGLPVRFIVQAPSCVPPQPGLELSGADLYSEDITTMLAWPEVGGLAEVMDMLGVLGADDRMVDIVASGLNSGKLVSGHASGLTGARLQAYLAAGIASDHEVFSDGEALEKLRAGLTVELRGMIDSLLPELIAHLNALPELPTHLVGCTDDLFALTLLEDGGMDDLVRRLIRYGLAAPRAIRLATYQAAYRLQREDLGLVAAGRRADLIVISDLQEFRVAEVFTDGRHVASGGRMVVPCVEGPSDPPLATMHLGAMAPADFALRLPDGTNGSVLLRVVDGILATTWSAVEAEVHEGVVKVPDGHLLQVVVHRHGRIPAVPQAALISGWGGEWTGAVATTVSHDTHNLVVFGRDPIAMAAAANAVIASDGGVAVTLGTKVLAHIALPIAGLLSPLPPAELAEAQRAAQDAARSIGLPQGVLTQPLFQVMVSTLACLPGPHVTDLGLIDGSTGELIPDPLVAA